MRKWLIVRKITVQLIVGFGLLRLLLVLQILDLFQVFTHFFRDVVLQVLDFLLELPDLFRLLVVDRLVLFYSVLVEGEVLFEGLVLFD